MNLFPIPKKSNNTVDAVQPKEKPDQEDILKKQYQEILERFRNVENIEGDVEKWTNYKGEGDTEKGKELLGLAIYEIEATCRHAFSMEADFIVCLDKSARNHGYIFNLVLPAIKLEYCKLNNKDPKDVNIPEVKFINPVKGDNEFHGSQKDQFKSAFAAMFANKNILVFDESSSSISEGEKDNLYMEYLGGKHGYRGELLEGRNKGKYIFLDPIKQYTLYKTIKKLPTGYIDDDQYERERTTARLVADNIANTVPTNKTDSHIGISSGGGNIRHFLLGLLGNKETNITADAHVSKSNEYYGTTEDWKNIFAKKTEKLSSQEIIDIRKYLKKIAKKIVEDVYEKSFKGKD